MDFEKDFDIELSDLKVRERDVAYKYWTYQSGGSILGCRIYEGILYFGCCDGYLYAVDAKTGKELWRFKTGGVIVSHMPEIHENVVYTVSYDGCLYAIDRNTGKEIWRFQTGDKCWSSPTYFNDTIYFGSKDENLYAVDAKTGREIWRFSTG
ncbi:MAG: PQQ-binding-like beta-propeller repeat protein, partial [Candidatus Aenigmatarchaeota archaeon]